MKNLKELKFEIYGQIAAFLTAKVKESNANISSAIESRNNDTKSSAGDKYETGRAMMQMEIDNNEIQLSKSFDQQKELSKIDLNRICKKVELGSLVITSHENYFISIAMGKISAAGQTFYAISLASPVGMVLKNKIAGESVEFMGRKLTIKEII